MMERRTWTADRGLLFARGLYHVAACDGIDPRERDALERFIKEIGLPATLEDLGALPFDYDEVADALDSTWLRRTFIRACRLMVGMDGVVSDAEQDAMRAMAMALGVGEDFALQDLDQGKPARAEEMVRWVAEMPVDYVSWDDAHQRGYFWAFPHPNHPLTEGAELHVAEGQALTVVHEESVVDVLGEGRHEADPQTLTGLAEATGWSGGLVNARLLYVRVGPTPVLRWGTSDAIPVRVQGQDPVPIRLFGRAAVQLVDPQEVVRRFCRRTVPGNVEVNQRLRRVISGRVGHALSQREYASVEALKEALTDLESLRKVLRPALEEAMEQSGLKLSRFLIENLTAPLQLGIRPIARKRTMQLLADGTLMAPTGKMVTAGEGKAPTLRPCIGCLNPVPTSARFCSRCGTPQRRPCAQCGSDLPAKARFCSDCGKPQVG